jgi:hypothetical protein
MIRTIPDQWLATRPNYFAHNAFSTATGAQSGNPFGRLCVCEQKACLSLLGAIHSSNRNLFGPPHDPMAAAWRTQGSMVHGETCNLLSSRRSCLPGKATA